MDEQPGSLLGARVHGSDHGCPSIASARRPPRDRRRFRSQAACLRRTCGRPAGESDASCREGYHEPRGGLRGHRADVSYQGRGQTGSHERRTPGRSTGSSGVRGGRLPGLIRGRWCARHLCRLRHPKRLHRGLRRRRQQSEDRRLSSSRNASRSAVYGNGSGRARREARNGSHRTQAAELGDRGHATHLRAGHAQSGVQGSSGGRPEPSALPRPTRWPG